MSAFYQQQQYQYPKLSQHQAIVPIIPKCVSARALNRINKRLVDRGSKRNYKVYCESTNRSPDFHILILELSVGLTIDTLSNISIMF